MYPNFARGQLLARLLPDYVVTAYNSNHVLGDVLRFGVDLD